MGSVGLTPRLATQARPGAAAPHGIEKYTWALGLLLVIATVGLYYPVSGHPFVNYDDNVYVTENEQVKSGLNWDTLQWAFTTTEAGNWHPLTWLSHTLDYQLFQADPAGHHNTNLLLHVLNALLLFSVLRQATGYTGRSWMVAALFALHPVNVESVAWISERQEPAEHVVFPARPRCLSLVCARASNRPLCCGCWIFCTRADGKTAGHHPSVRAAALGLLAVAADVNRRASGCFRRAR